MTYRQSVFPLLTHLSHTVVSVVRHLARPHQSIQDKEERQNAQLLSGILLTTIASISLIIALVVYFDPDDLYNLRTTVAFTVIIVSVVFYGFNRIGYTERATFGFITFIAGVVLVTAYVGSFSEFVAFAVVPMLLVGMFYPFRWALGFIASILITVFVLNNLQIDETIWQRRILWYFLLFAGALVLAFKAHLNQLEIIRRQKLDEANTRLRATLNAIPDILLEVDYVGHILDYRMPENSVFHISIDNYLSRTVREVFPEETATIIMEAIEGAAKTGKHTGSVFSLDVVGETHWFEISVSAKGNIHTNDNLRFVILARNITERKQAEFLQTKHARLEVELEKEKELTQLRSQLISIIAHEFRTPLTVILISGSLLVDYGDRLTPTKQNEKIRSIVEQVKRLDTMLDNVSTLSKSQRGFLQYNPHHVDIVAFCEQLVSELKSISPPNNELVFNVEGEFELVELDPNLLRHALTNLISNAIKYSPDGGVVSLRLKRNEDCIVFCIIDEGIGIPPEDMHYLFQPFHRATNVSNIHGTGLGLSIVKEAVVLQGGDITCESELGVGTTFSITIPIREAIKSAQNTND